MRCKSDSRYPDCGPSWCSRGHFAACQPQLTRCALRLPFSVPSFFLSPNLFRMLGSSTYLIRLLRRRSIPLPESVWESKMRYTPDTEGRNNQHTPVHREVELRAEPKEAEDRRGFRGQQPLCRAGACRGHPVHDTLTKIYRHLHFFQRACELEVRIPRVKLPDRKVIQVTSSGNRHTLMCKSPLCSASSSFNSARRCPSGPSITRHSAAENWKNASRSNAVISRDRCRRRRDIACQRSIVTSPFSLTIDSVRRPLGQLSASH